MPRKGKRVPSQACINGFKDRGSGSHTNPSIVFSIDEILVLARILRQRWVMPASKLVAGSDLIDRGSRTSQI